MKTTNFKAFATLVGLLLLNIQSMNAGVVDKVQKFAGDQVSNFNILGLLVIGGIVGASLVIYIISNHLIKDKDDRVTMQTGQTKRQSHQRHHHARQIVKKTS